MRLKIDWIMNNKKRIIVLASGSGTNFINIYNNITNGIVVLLISNNPKSGAVEYARKNEIDFIIINDFRYPNNSDKIKEYKLVLNRYKTDLILLAGFMKKIPNEIIELYKNKILNIHPSLLPKYGGRGYYGIKVHEAVLKANEKTTGASVHFVNREYDKGPIIMQKKIEVLNSDNAKTLSERVLKIEYILYLKVIELFCTNKINIKDNMVSISE